MSGYRDPATLPLLPDDPVIRRAAEQIDRAFAAACALEAELRARMATPAPADPTPLVGTDRKPAA